MTRLPGAWLRLVCAFACGALMLGAQAPAPPLSADEIMQRVAASQDRAQQLRSAYVYHQKILIRSLDSHRKVRAEETSEFEIIPGPANTKKEPVSVTGRYLKKGKYIQYKDSGPVNSKSGANGDVSITLGGNEVQNLREFREEFTNDAKSRDGLNRELFPLTTKEMARYDFTLKGEETSGSIPVYRVAFAPKQKPGHEFEIDTSEGPWEGEVLVSRDEFQPVYVTTRLATHIPAAVKILLGTNLHGLGFSVRYQKFDSDVWFPVSYGTEFSVRVLFFYARTFTVAMSNSGFHRADVNSTIQPTGDKQ
jgi:hypothetical protein